MGIKGYTVYVFRNVYYIFEHDFDITPDDLGNDFVIKLKEDFLVNRNTLVDSEVIRDEILYEQFDNEDTVIVTVVPPIIHDNIKWIYTANFDTKIFSVESSNYNTLYYNLLNIPDNWVDMLW